MSSELHKTITTDPSQRYEPQNTDHTDIHPADANIPANDAGHDGGFTLDENQTDTGFINWEAVEETAEDEEDFEEELEGEEIWHGECTPQFLDPTMEPE